ncbi:hypothetical protein C8N24_5790 [Solirubrobacter pauli]|uniref:Uncharacterized protein n=1 Tax=Solirubrobacter pauli TaxID=166793 RepID=A0A660L199_9ACTN|nr:hypothetical protein [Solirubrobacter pauli]RKQ87761.1 hypothetical protein C8N24_5790 [Solirubrobacter pauli]
MGAPSARLARAGGLVLLGSLFLPWFRIHQQFGVLRIEGEPSPPPPTPRSWLESAWGSLALLDVVLAALAVVIVLVPRLRVYAAWAAVAVIATRLVELPEYGSAERSWGGFVGLAGALMAAWPERRPRPAEALVGGAGFVLLLSLALPWYGATLATLYPGTPVPDAGTRLEWTAWQRLAVVDVLVAAIAVLAALVALHGAAPAARLKAVGWLAVVLVAVRIVIAPAPYTTDYGAYVALVAATVAWGAAWLASGEAPRAVA